MIKIIKKILNYKNFSLININIYADIIRQKFFYATFEIKIFCEIISELIIGFNFKKLKII